MGSPIPLEVSRELRRVGDRWNQLPVDHARSCMPAVRDVLARLAQRTLAGSSVPDLGPAMVVAQLAVLTYDVCRSDPAYPILDELSALRRALTSPTRPDLGHRV